MNELIHIKEALHRETRALEAAKQELQLEGKIITPASYLRHCFASVGSSQPTDF